MVDDSGLMPNIPAKSYQNYSVRIVVKTLIASFLRWYRLEELPYISPEVTRSWLSLRN